MKGDLAARRGQPLIALVLIMSGWTTCRFFLWAPPMLARSSDRASSVTVEAEQANLFANFRPAQGTALLLQSDPAASEAAVPWPTVPAASPPRVRLETVEPPRQAISPRILAGQQMLWLAGMSALSLPPEALRAQPPDPITPGAPNLAPAPRHSRGAAEFADQPAEAGAMDNRLAEPRLPRWSADGWLLYRRESADPAMPGAGLAGALPLAGHYGASQAGLVVRYRLGSASRDAPQLYLRASTALQAGHRGEMAGGLAVRPWSAMPARVIGEARITQTSGGAVIRPALALVSEVPPLSLPLGLRGDAYAQTGWVGGHDHSRFIDGQVRLEKPLLSNGKVQLRTGLGLWGGAQLGAGRLDFGPSATMVLAMGSASGRVSADYRIRLSGKAEPGTGPAVTLSAGF